MSERQTGSSEMYGIGDQEILNTNLNDCVERYLDAIPPGDLPKHAPVVKVEHYRPRALESGALFMDTHLDALYESLDEEYGNPEGDATEPTQAVRQAWQTFLDVVRAEYVSWFCDPTRGNHRGRPAAVDPGRGSDLDEPRQADRPHRTGGCRLPCHPQVGGGRVARFP